MEVTGGFKTVERKDTHALVIIRANNNAVCFSFSALRSNRDAADFIFITCCIG